MLGQKRAQVLPARAVTFGQVFELQRLARVLAHPAVVSVEPLQIDAIVVVPDPPHRLWRLPEGDSDFSTRCLQI
jgi:hypothetical protein